MCSLRGRGVACARPAAAHTAQQAVERSTTGGLGVGPEAEFGHTEQVHALHELAAKIVARGFEAFHGFGALAGIVREADEDIGAVEVGGNDDLRDLYQGDTGIGGFIADELGELFPHLFGDTAGTKFVHYSSVPRFGHDKGMNPLIVGLLVLVGLYGLHRLACWMEARGWIYWTKSGGHSTRAGNAMLEVQQLLEPGKKHVIELKQDEKAERDDQGGDR